MEHHFSVMRTLLLVIAVFVPPCLTFPPNVGHCPSNFDGPLPDKTCHWDMHCPVGYKCCVFNNIAVCVPSIPVEKKCPDRNGTIGLCAFLCFSDSECSNGELCCTNGCGGRDCTPPLIVKPGQCPDPGFTHQCGTRCFQDGQCSGEMKCCPTSCGQACRQPI